MFRLAEDDRADALGFRKVLSIDSSDMEMMQTMKNGDENAPLFHGLFAVLANTALQYPTLNLIERRQRCAEEKIGVSTVRSARL